MTLAKALAYFVREAGVSLARSWKVSLIAVATITVSLFVGGVFLVVAGNLARVVEQARDESRVVVYFQEGAPDAAIEGVARTAKAPTWVRSATRVSAEEARRRFIDIFPSLSDLVEGEGSRLPASLEIDADRDAAGAAAYSAWIESLRHASGVSMVDDDRDWVRQLAAMVAVVRGLGLALGGVLLGAAVFTIGSVIRLTAYLYQEEISIMRLVGATEFYIRGPFYLEGTLQGLLGGGLAAGTLAGVFWLAARRLGGSLLGGVLVAHPPGPVELLALVALGTAAGLFGAVFSLRRESLGEPPVDEV